MTIGFSRGAHQFLYGKLLEIVKVHAFTDLENLIHTVTTILLCLLPRTLSHLSYEIII